MVTVQSRDTKRHSDVVAGPLDWGSGMWARAGVGWG